jgi:hypothetical protein
LFATYPVGKIPCAFPQKLVTLLTRFFDRMVHNAHWINLAWPQPAARTPQQKHLPPDAKTFETGNGGTDIAAASQKTHQRPPYGLASLTQGPFRANPALNRLSPASRSLATAPPEGALARGLLRPSSWLQCKDDRS